MNRKIKNKLYTFLILWIALFGIFGLPIFVKAEIYVLSGQNFYSYDTRTDTWTTRANFPVTTGAGRSLVYPGTGDYIYALSGNNTNGFYRFNINTYTWQSSWGSPSLAHPAPGTVGAGGGLVYPGTGDYIYAIRGGNTNNFYRYSISTFSWTSLSNTNLGNISAGGSSCSMGVDPMAGDFSNFIWTIRGANTNVLYRYSIDTNSWLTFATPLPQNASTGSNIDCGWGTSDIFAFLKDTNGVRYFGKLSTFSNSWTSYALPTDGDDISYYFWGSAGAQQRVYSLRNNNTAELYKSEAAGSFSSWVKMANAPANMGVYLSGVVVPTTPTSPTNLVTSPYISATAKIRLTWETPSDNGGSFITGYKIERESPVGGGWSTLVENSGTNLQYDDTNISPKVVYNYRVSAVNAKGAGSVSNTSSSIYPTVPGAPTQLTATYSSGRINLQWVAPLDDGASAITGYVIERNNGSGWVALVPNTGNQNVVYTDSAISSGTSYSYRVKAINIRGPGSSSNNAVVSYPDAPTGLNAVFSSGTINLSWVAPASNGAPISGYKVERSANGGSTWNTLVNNTGNSNTTYSDTNILSGASYSYKVSAINIINTGPASSASSTIALPAAAPGAPIGLTTVCGGGRVNLSWTAPVHDGGSAITGYKIERQNTDGTWSIIVANTNSTATSYKDTGAGYTPILGVDQGSSVSWICKGTNGGTNSGVCTATRAPFNIKADNLRMTTNYCWAPKTGLLNFTWTYTNSDNNPESRFQFQIDDQSNFSSPIIDKDVTNNANINSVAVLVSTSNPLNGFDWLPFDDLANSKNYYWRVKVYDSLGIGSNWIVSGSETGGTFVPAPFRTEPHPWPTPAFSYAPATPKVSQDTHFIDNSGGTNPVDSKCYSDHLGTEYNCRDNLGGKISYEWIYGDNSESGSLGDVYHKYTKVGKYKPKLKICEALVGCCEQQLNIVITGQKVPQWREVSPF